MIKRPIVQIDEFQEACRLANLTDDEQKLIDFIRYKGIFTQQILIRELGMKSKPPALTIICKVCRKIGENMPNHFKQVREWSQQYNEFKVKWDGDLICSYVLNIDGEKLCPENPNAQYHTFSVHKELFQGLD